MSKASLTEKYDSDIRPQLDLIDKLRSIGLNSLEGIQLPQIVTVGDQSSGKSSILEALAQVELPRDDQICTRCPIVIRLKQLASANDEPSATITYKKAGSTAETCHFVTHKQVNQVVRKAQTEITGDSKGVVNSPIELNIASHNVPNLTLIDMPGLVASAGEGQDDSIVATIEEMIMEYIEPSNTIILAVMDGSQELATSKSLAIAKMADPKCERTIGVLTKCDKAKDATEKGAIVATCNGGGTHKLALGFVVVRNRSSDELKANSTSEQAIQMEKEFFQNGYFKQKLPDGTYGRDALASRLTALLGERVRQHLPDIKTKVSNMLIQVKRDLNNPMLAAIPTDPGMQRFEFIDMIRKLVNEARQTIHGEKNGGVCSSIFERLRLTSEEIHERSMNYVGPEAEEKDESMFMERIKKSIQENAGLGSGVGGYLSYKMAERFVNEYIESIECCIDKCVEEVQKLVDKTLTSVIDGADLPFKDANSAIRFLFDAQLETSSEITRERVKYLLDTEKYAMYASNTEYEKKMTKRVVERLGLDTLRTLATPDPLGHSHHGQAHGTQANGFQAFSQKVTELTNKITDSRHADEERLFDSVQVYVEHAGTRLMDSVPMIIRRELMLDIWNRFDQLMRDLRDGEKPEIYLTDERVSRLLREPKELTIRRDNLNMQKTVLEASQKAIVKII